MNRPQIEKQLVEKATQDPAFRQSLKSDPRLALEKELGIKVPSAMKLEIIEESADSLCLVLPAPKGELSDLELESVAGGKGEGNNNSGTILGAPSNLAGEAEARRRLGE